MLRRFLRLLDKPMKQHHGAFGEPKEHPRRTAVRQVASQFPKPVSKRPAHRKTDGSPEFNLLDVPAYGLPVIQGKCLQPSAHGFLAIVRGKEPGRYFLQWVHPFILCTIFDAASSIPFTSCHHDPKCVPPQLELDNSTRQNV